MSDSFVSTKLAEIEAFLSERFAQVTLGRQVGAAEASYQSRGEAELATDDVKLGFEFAYDFDALDAVCIITVRGGGISRLENGADVTFGVGDTYSVGPPGRPHSGRAVQTSFRTVRLSPSSLSTVAGPLRYDRDRPVRLTGHTANSVGAQRRLASVIDHVHDHVLSGPPGNQQPLLLSTARQYLAAAVLDCFPSNAAKDPTAQDSRDAGSASIRRALSYLEGHAMLPITVVDIAQAAHVTPRALQLAFRRHLDTTPMARLRAARLELVHQALLEAHPGAGVTVRQTATRHGFADYGRFTAVYRQRYGQSPVTTLRS